MKNLYRVIDANVNRVSEGIRILEDLARFSFEKPELSSQLRELRHKVRKGLTGLEIKAIEHRDSINDVGYITSKENSLDQKKSLKALIIANFKRAEEGLRVIEESFNLEGNYTLAKAYEECRYNCYALEKDFLLTYARKEKAKALTADLYCITAEEHSLGRSNIEVVKEMIAAGVKIIQYREKDKLKLYKYEECVAIRELTKAAGVTFIVNDDVDIALAVKADGIHIGQEDTPIEKVREIVGEGMIIGLSTHSPLQAEDAVKRGADYIGVGPIFKTYTKKDVCDPVGLEYLEYVVKNIKLPFVAIGGIKDHNISQVVAKGAKCICLVTDITGAQDIQGKIKELREKLK